MHKNIHTPDHLVIYNLQLFLKQYGQVPLDLCMDAPGTHCTPVRESIGNHVVPIP